MTLNKGVNVREGDSIAAITGRGARITGLMGTFARGPLNKAVYCGNRAEFEAIFGSYAVPLTTSYYDAIDMFANGGNMQAAIVNVKGPAAAQASRTIQDIDASPQNTLKIKWKGYGADGNRASFALTDDSRLVTRLKAALNPAGTSASLESVALLEAGSVLKFNNGTQSEKVVVLTVTPNPDGSGTVTWTGGVTNTYTVANTTVSSVEFMIIVYYDNVEIKRFRGLSKNPTVSFFHTKVINVDEMNYPIETEDIVSPSTPLYDQWPATNITPLTLTGGDDDVDGLEVSHWIGSAVNGTGVYAFETVEGLLRLACPNPKINTSASDGYKQLLRAMLALANTRDRSARGFEVYAEVPFGTSVNDALVFSREFEGRLLSLWYDWQTGKVAGNEAASPIIGALLGAAAAKDASLGIYHSIGNYPIVLRGVPYYKYSEANDNLMAEYGINTITQNGARVWSGYTLSANPLWRFVNHSEQFIDIAQTLKTETADVVFRPMNDSTINRLHRRLDDYFRGKQADGEILNYTISVAPAAANVLRVSLSIGLVGVAEKIDYVLKFDNSGFVETELGAAA